MRPMWLPFYFCSFSIYIYIGRFNIYGAYVTANNSNNNVVFFFVSDLKIVLFCALFFGLLSLSLLLVVITQRFGRCILRPSSGVPCLCGYGNDLTGEIIFKVWLLIKQDVQETWRYYSNNNVIVFHVNQPKKHHKNLLEKHHEMNLKPKIPLASVILDIFKVKIISFGLSNYSFLDCVHFIEKKIFFIQRVKARAIPCPH